MIVLSMSSFLDVCETPETILIKVPTYASMNKAKWTDVGIHPFLKMSLILEMYFLQKCLVCLKLSQGYADDSG